MMITTTTGRLPRIMWHLVAFFHLAMTSVQGLETGQAPRIVPIKSVLQVFPGKQVFIPCDVTGDPAPSVRWYKGSEPLGRATERYIVHHEDHSLVVHELAMQDEANYTCVAWNKWGQDRVSIYLQVFLPPEAEIETPEVLPMEKRPYQMTCRAKGKPKVMFQWFSNKQVLISNNDSSNASQRLSTHERELSDEYSSESTLVISPVLYTDRGEFLCLAHNEAGTARVAFHLDVHFKPRLPKRPEDEIVYWWEGHRTNLTCVSQGNPTPKVTWIGDLEGMPTEVEQEGGQSTLWITPTADTKSYVRRRTCLASNEYGMDKTHFILKQAYKPMTPVVKILKIHMYEVTLSIEVPEQDDTPPVTYLTASYRIQGDTSGPLFTEAADVTPGEVTLVTLRGMYLDREYDVTIKVGNVVGSSEVLLNIGQFSTVDTEDDEDNADTNDNNDNMTNNNNNNNNNDNNNTAHANNTSPELKNSNATILDDQSSGDNFNQTGAISGTSGLRNVTNEEGERLKTLQVLGKGAVFVVSPVLMSLAFVIVCLLTDSTFCLSWS